MAKYDLLNSYLSRVLDRVTLTWPELDAIVEGLPKSATEYRAWWGGGHIQEKAWKSAGFEVTNLQLGSQVTFIRTSSRSVNEMASSKVLKERLFPTAIEPNETQLIGADILLMSCVKKKQHEGAAAKELFLRPVP